MSVTTTEEIGMSVFPENKLRLVRFRPYRKGMGPTFSLYTFILCNSAHRIGYVLKQHDGPDSKVIFQGSDFRPGASTVWDSDHCIEAIMGFLTLRLGDTDEEWFVDYNEVQKGFRDTHAEILAWEVEQRFGRRD